MKEHNYDIEGDRYHKKIGFPEKVEFPTGEMNLYITPHARKEAQMDMHGYFKLPKQVNVTEEMYERTPEEAIGETTKPHVFDMVVQDGEVIRIGLRKNLDSNRDKVLVINPIDEDLVTCWSNLKDEHQNEVNKQRYNNPEVKH